MKSINRFCFMVALAFTACLDRLQGRAVATNVLLTPHETSRGTQSMDADAGIVTTTRNAVVKVGSDDRHFALPNAAADIPIGVLLNDQVDSGEAGVIRKQVAIFGLYAESLPANATGAINAGAEVVVDPATSGSVRQLPGASGTYVVFGRARYAVAAGGNPVSIIHCVPRVVVIP